MVSFPPKKGTIYIEIVCDTHTCLTDGDGARGLLWTGVGRSSALLGGTGFLGGTMGAAGLAGFSGKGLTTSKEKENMCFNTSLLRNSLLL